MKKFCTTNHRKNGRAARTGRGLARDAMRAETLGIVEKPPKPSGLEFFRLISDC